MVRTISIAAILGGMLGACMGCSTSRVRALATSPTGCTLEGRYTWESSGGMVAQHETVILEPPAAYQTIWAKQGRAPVSCTVPLPPCGAAAKITVGDLARALAHADVVRALAEADRYAVGANLFGHDLRPVDGTVQVLRETRTGREVVVGEPCEAGVPECRAIPPGLKQLIELLDRLHSQQLAAPLSCA